ncbi:MAG: RNA 2',3'-cyclic phosphodiesterase [Geminicoccaceae bacterium]
MPRLFIALDLPDDIKDSLLDLAMPLPATRWQGGDQLHLTLRFLGEVDPGRIAPLTRALETVDVAPFAIQLKGLGHFPPRGEPRVLWVGVEGREPLERLRRAVSAALDEVGVDYERRKFTPHVTIARIAAPLPTNRLASFLTKRSLFRSESFLPPSFSLYQSFLRPGGAEYHAIATYPLVPDFDGLDDDGADDVAEE